MEIRHIPEFKKAAAGTCLCLVMIGLGGEVVRLASPLCDWHWTVCTESPDAPIHAHIDVATPYLATSSG